MPGELQIRFVTSPRGNYHMTEILSALCETVREEGVEATLESSRFPDPSPATVYVVIPHEHRACEPADAWPSREQRLRTIALCVENPHTSWFEAVCALAWQFPGLVAINRCSVEALHERNVTVQHIQLGYTALWDVWHGQPGPRPVDITYLGAEDPRRDSLLAGYGRWWWPRRTAILAPKLAPKNRQSEDYLVDHAKYAHLRQSKILVNLHREGSSAFEWVRVLQAMANGCVVVSEPSHDHAPLVPGRHFIAADADSIPHVVEILLQQPERLEAMRMSAYEAIRNDLDMAAAARRLIETAERLRAATDARAAEDRPPQAPPPRAPDGLADAAGRTRALIRTIATETLQLRRSVQRLAERAEGRDPDAAAERVVSTPAFDAATPRVSVAITLHNYEHEVGQALASVTRSRFDDYEVIVLDDASTDGSLRAARDFLVAYPWLPATLLRSPVNRGLGATRNTLARQARGELMFVLDADNAIYPTALGKLVDALDRDPGAAFAYPLIAMTRSGTPAGLLSRFAWDPELFRRSNYIDAMALIRLDDFFALGGYTEDIRMTGWEDFFFWCACAESHRRGRLVPEVLATYRQTGHSLLEWTQTDTSAAWSVLNARFPEIIPSTPET